MLKEIWKDVKGFESYYQISNYGKVKSLSRICRANTCGIRNIKEKILSMCQSKNGYYTVILCKNGKHKSVSIHRLVAETFIPNPENKKEVNHKDENKLNNYVGNLEWCDRVYNANFGTGVERCAKQKFKPVAMIELETNKVLKTFISQKEASKIMKISNKNISSVCRGKRNEAGGYKWKFLSEVNNEN